MSDPHNSDLKQAIDRIERARQYTLELLDGIDPADWFRRPAEGVTHIAWQVGHLTMAQYALALMRVRDSQPGDRELMSRKFRRHFAKGSSPVAEPETGTLAWASTRVRITRTGEVGDLTLFAGALREEEERPR